MCEAAEALIKEEKYVEAEQKCLEEIRQNPENLKPYATLLTIYGQTYDADSAMSAGRETLQFARLLLKEFFEKKDYDFADDPKSLQYIEILDRFGKVSKELTHVNFTCYIYEEILRLNKSDKFGNARILLFVYLEIIGYLSNNKKGVITRTPEMANKLIETFKIPEENPEVRLWRILEKFLKKDDSWKDLVKKEEQENQLIFRVWLNEVEKGEKIDKFVQDYFGKLAKAWPNFRIEAHKILRKEHQKFMKAIEDEHNEVMEDRKPDFYTFIYSTFMKNGREAMRDFKFNECVKMFTLARNVAYETALPYRFQRSEKFEYAIISNRCTCYLQLNKPAEARQDARFTLFVKFDHFKVLEKCQEIGRAWGLPENVITAFKDWLAVSKDAKSGVRREIAKKVIALLSLEGLYRVRTEDFEKVAADLFERQCDDMYVQVNIPAEQHDLLPWLTANDLEKPIPR
ncbi:hypothetical protein TVAG_130210 [Trichomonas vaginalis G3]|uniref:Uncharacterized protein n=1 Tax=Trichomonas vaginalis (strain ATCC PRA-98 / G3) TaxID=412133 RepID=A2DIB7_TRIV3|nr:TPR-like family [Trichomonas vaginalis G3]EAY19913.1 hypothetical protein TVAG_130210 [Trichomonas vaginalis G3]KAI5509953.1 TPR-like family [Trichomonas vaginalis G3]|eukprot:XP_001580899.1 hypothetical protein [Trichomonas vaginalis G3]